MNAQGKSTFINLIHYALFGKTIDAMNNNVITFDE